MGKMIRGKAVLKLTRTEWHHQEGFRFDLAVLSMTCRDGRAAAEAIWEDWSLIETDSLPAPDCAYKLKIGQSVTVSVAYEFYYSRDSQTGEGDIDLYYNRQYVLKRTKYNPRSERKNYRTGQCWSYPNRRHEARRF